jgi:predicted NBD/HSP70 family sugar kinase
LETETSLLIIVEKAKEALNSGKLSILKAGQLIHHEQASETILSAAQEGDRFAVDLVSEAGYNIGRGVAILIHILNPESIILSGRGAAAGKIWQAPIQQAINEHCIPRLAANTAIEMSNIGYAAELIGAGALVMENFEKETLKKDFAVEPGPGYSLSN